MAGRFTSSLEWSASILTSLHTYRQKNFFCDTILQSKDGGSFTAHSNVLASASPYMCHQLLQCSLQKYVIAVPVSGRILECVLEYIYTGQWNLPAFDYQEVTEAARLCGIQPPGPQCAEAEENSMSLKISSYTSLVLDPHLAGLTLPGGNDPGPHYGKQLQSEWDTSGQQQQQQRQSMSADGYCSSSNAAAVATMGKSQASSSLDGWQPEKAAAGFCTGRYLQDFVENCSGMYVRFPADAGPATVQASHRPVQDGAAVKPGCSSGKPASHYTLPKEYRAKPEASNGWSESGTAQSLKVETSAQSLDAGYISACSGGMNLEEEHNDTALPTANRFGTCSVGCQASSYSGANIGAGSPMEEEPAAGLARARNLSDSGSESSLQQDLRRFLKKSNERRSRGSTEMVGSVTTKEVAGGPFSCQVCGKWFTKSSGRKRHETTHKEQNVNREVLKCRYCDKTYLSYKGRYVHEKRQHSQARKKVKRGNVIIV